MLAPNMLGKESLENKSLDKKILIESYVTIFFVVKFLGTKDEYI